MLPDSIGLESTENACILSLRAATDQKAGGSNPSRRAKTPVKSVDFTGVLFDFRTFYEDSFWAAPFDPYLDPYGKIIE